MRKFFILLVGLVASITVISQQVNKNYVLVEIFTSTGCYYCPGAELGALDLVENGQDVAVIAYHHNSFGDQLYNSAGLSRINYYGYQGTPDAYFNGIYNVGGGDHTNSMYSSYLPKYNLAINELTSFTCDVNLTTTNELDFTANVSVEKVDTYSGSNINLFLAVIENDIPYNWEGLDHLHFLERGMYPSGSGIDLDFSSQSTINETVDFTIDPSWNIENCELIVFVQDMTTKEVLQVNKAQMDLPAGDNNIILQAITSPNENEIICATDITPSILFKNKGNNNLTSVDFEIFVNDELLDTYNWTGDLIMGETSEILLNNISYNQLDENEIKVVAINPNGVTDDYPENNADSLMIYKSDETTTRLFLYINSGSWGFEISYSLFDANGNEIASNSGFGNSEQVLDTFIVDVLDECYYFELNDSYGNGFNSDDGFCILTDNKADTLFNVSGNFGYVQEYSFRPTTIANIDNLSNNKISIYPNPVENFFDIKLDRIDDYNITIFDVNGRVVKSTKIENSNLSTINTNDLLTGTYFVLVQSNSFTISKKIIVK